MVLQHSLQLLEYYTVFFYVPLQSPPPFPPLSLPLFGQLLSMAPAITIAVAAAAVVIVVANALTIPIVVIIVIITSHVLALVAHGILTQNKIH
jgi:hypothetical protein